MSGDVLTILSRHAVSAKGPSDTACRCDRTWRSDAAYREHVAEAIEGHDRLVRANALRRAAGQMGDDTWKGVGPNLHLDYYPAAESIRAWLHGRADREETGE